jgi:hypothetical protein
MDSTLNGAVDEASSEESAVRNANSTASTLKLVLLWLAVSIPMLWGILKALEDVRPLFR